MPLAPRWIPTLATLVVVLCCVRLGIWQLDRHDQAEQRREMLSDLHALPPLEGASAVQDPAAAYRRSRLEGCYLPAPAGIVTGGLHQGSAGHRLFQLYEVQGQRLLVERGWIPAHQQVSTFVDAACEPVEGLLVPVEHKAASPPEEVEPGIWRWAMGTDELLGLLPRVLGPPLASMSKHARLDAPLALQRGPRMSSHRHRVDGPAPIGGYLVPVPTTHHLSYAAQWFGFALLALAIWLWASWRRHRRQAG